MISNMHLAKVGSLNENTSRKPEASFSGSTNAFRELFENQITEPLQFSKHASIRLNDRNISLTGEQIDRVTEGIGKAGAKGIRDSLVLVDNVALVVNIKSRTVITAIPQSQENVFTNIDGAVVV